MWVYCSSFRVSSHRRLVLKLALQHYTISLWCLSLWDLLYFWHLDPYFWYLNVVCLYFQQFLHWGTPGFMLVSLIVAICWLILKHLFMNIFTFVPFWKSQISTYMIAMSNLIWMIKRHVTTVTWHVTWGDIIGLDLKRMKHVNSIFTSWKTHGIHMVKV